MKKFLSLLAFAAASVAVYSQTNVSGGIFANTTWTLANSPYIVTADVVVFPGYTLTIEPGVVVKFDSGTQLEIRQGSLIAVGNSADSITFTTNGAAVHAAWNQVYLNGGSMLARFEYCNVHYASGGIKDVRNNMNDSLIIRHCNFRNNSIGFTGTGTGLNCGIIEYSSFTLNDVGANDIYGTTMNYCDMSYNQTGFKAHSINTLNHCTFNHNSAGLADTRNTTLNYCTVNANATGISAGNGVVCYYCTIDSNSTYGVDITKTSTLQNCVLDYNSTAIYDHNIGSNPCNIRYNAINANNTGIALSLGTDSIVCNHICDNITYDLQYMGSNNINLKRNYWCVPDSASLQPLIYDAHDNISYGIVNYMPMDDGNCAVVTGLQNDPTTAALLLFPNPATTELNIQLASSVANAKVIIYNMTGQVCYASAVSGPALRIDISNLANGMYYVVLNANGIVVRKKFMKE